MGESNQSKKTFKRLERLLNQCDEKHVFKGTVFEFDVIGSVPNDRIIRGMLVDRKEGIRRVNFSNREINTSKATISNLNSGDSVAVLGMPHPQGATATLPMLIMCPDEQAVLFAQEPESLWWTRPRKVACAGSYLLLLILCALYWLVSFSPDYSNYSGLVGMSVLAMFLFLGGAALYRDYVGKARMIRFDSQGWKHVVNITNNHFQLEI